MDAKDQLLGALERGGFLLVQDRVFPNLVAVVTGETLRGSWWAHPRCHEIFRALTALTAERDVLVTKLIHGNVTFVHRRLWQAVLSVAVARESWQTKGLSREAGSLLEQVEREGTIAASGPESAELERRLLAHGDQIHTESGKHKTQLETWPVWALRCGCEPARPAAPARHQIETAIRELGFVPDCLPWGEATRAGRSASGQTSSSLTPMPES
jgi:hypothetical protein